MTTKTMTREELDEAIVLLHEPKPDKPTSIIEWDWDSPLEWWKWNSDIQFWCAVCPTTEIVFAKRLTDELVKERKIVKVTTMLEGHDTEPTTRVQLFWEELDLISCRPAERRIECFATGQYHEELARSLAYYEAKTGIRVEIKENDEPNNS